MARAETREMVDSEHARRNEDDVMLFFMEELDDCNRTPSQETEHHHKKQNTITRNRRKVPSIWKSGRQVCIRFQFDHVSPMDSEWPTHSYNPIFRKIYLKIIRCDVRLVHQAILS